jgi:hypothetical protein
MTVIAPTQSGSAVDTRLVLLVEAAERGDDCPFIRMIAGGWLLQGQPASTETFLTQTHRGLYEELADSKEGRRLRGSQADKHAVLGAAVAPMVNALGGPGLSSLDALSLVDASAYPPGAPTIHMPTIRVPLSAVSAWWATGFSTDKSSSSSSVGVGFSF